jgi:hypothetical protein
MSGQGRGCTEQRSTATETAACRSWSGPSSQRIDITNKHPCTYHWLRRTAERGPANSFVRGEPHADAREVDDFLRADAVVKGLVDVVPTDVVVEVSCTGDVEDIVRAERRPKALQKAGFSARPLIACDAISPESLAFARMTGVRVWCNGSMVEAAA